MTTRRVRLACFAVVLFLCSAYPAFAVNVRMVRLSLVQGDVQIDRNSGDGWEQAIVNMPVISGARIYAAENSKAELEFEDGSNVRLVGPAQISLVELSSTPAGAPVNAVQVDSGIIYVNARLHDHEEFRISAYSGESFKITKPSHLRFTVNDQTASLAMTDGEAVAQNASGNGTIRSGETYNYILGQPASAARLESVPPQPDDSWNQQRESYNDQNAAPGAQYPGGEAYAPGQADLDYYGNYSDIPGYGESWQPNGVGPDWSPFDYGAWCNYPWGWTFVSAYPWGWSPFFYGNWFFLNGRGWFWHPGHGHGPGSHGPGFGFHPRPQFAGTAPRGFSAPHPPAATTHGTVAVAGSHLRVGPIGATHAPAGASGFATAGPTGVRAGTPASFAGSSSAGPVHLSAPSSFHGQSITGGKGTYTLRGSSTGPNGNAVHRLPDSIAAPHSYAGSSYAPRSAYGSGGYIPRSAYTGSSYAPRMYSAPAMGYAPHISSGGGAIAAPHGSAGFSGGISHAGGFSGGGFHGGGFSGGGFHGGGGHR